MFLENGVLHVFTEGILWWKGNSPHSSVSVSHFLSEYKLVGFIFISNICYHIQQWWLTWNFADDKSYKCLYRQISSVKIFIDPKACVHHSTKWSEMNKATCCNWKVRSMPMIAYDPWSYAGLHKHPIDSPLLCWPWGPRCCCHFLAARSVCALACTVSGCDLPPCLVPCSRPVGGCGAWRIQLESRSVVEAGTGLVGKVAPWLQGELGPLGYPAETTRRKL